jgi:DNA adenine methylase
LSKIYFSRQSVPAVGIMRVMTKNGTKPPFSYYGGKQRLASRIVPLLPRHTVYAEPFCGGATILFRKPWPKVMNTDYYREVINDTNSDVVNFFEQLRDNGEELCRLLKLTPYSQEEYKKAKTRTIPRDSVERARAFFIHVNQSFANNLLAGWGTAVYGANQSTKWTNGVNRLPQYIERMKGVSVANEDALRFIDRWDSPHTLFYCDPPYPSTNQGHYGGYTLDDFRALVDKLNACKGNFVLSCYDVIPDEMPQDWERFEFKSTMTAARDKSLNKSRTEVVWRRFNRVPVRDEIQKLYNSGAFSEFAFPLQDMQQLSLFS